MYDVKYHLPADDYIENQLDISLNTVSALVDDLERSDQALAHNIYVPRIGLSNNYLPPQPVKQHLMLPGRVTSPVLNPNDFSYFDDITMQCNIEISSYKFSNGLPALLSNDLSQYWQSDGNTPHSIDIELPEQRILSYLCFYIDRAADESYTPNNMTVKVGLSAFGLTDLCHIQLAPPPTGWIIIPLQDYNRHLQQLERYTIANQQKTASIYYQHIQHDDMHHQTTSQDVLLPLYETMAIDPFDAKIPIIAPPSHDTTTVQSSNQIPRMQCERLDDVTTGSPTKTNSQSPPTVSTRPTSPPPIIFPPVFKSLGDTGDISTATATTATSMFSSSGANAAVLAARPQFIKKSSMHLQIEIESSFQLGRDCRIHGLKLYAYKIEEEQQGEQQEQHDATSLPAHVDSTMGANIHHVNQRRQIRQQREEETLFRQQDGGSLHAHHLDVPRMNIDHILYPSENMAFASTFAFSAQDRPGFGAFR